MTTFPRIHIDDEPVQEARMAKATAYSKRKQTMVRWMQERKVKVLEDNDPRMIRCQIGDDIFSDPRETFPTEGTIARCALAIANGQRADTTETETDPLAYPQMAARVHREAVASKNFYDTYDAMNFNERRLVGVNYRRGNVLKVRP